MAVGGEKMRRLLWLCLFCLTLAGAIAGYNSLINQDNNFETIVVDLKEETEVKQFQELAQNLGLRPTLNSPFSAVDQVYVLEQADESAAANPRALLKTLRRSELAKSAEFIEPNYIYHTLEVPNDPDYSKQWNFRSINIETAWDRTKGKGITVAVIDTGITRVPDLKQTTLIPGYDFVHDRSDTRDDNGHGTHIAGIIAQSTNNAYGVAGIAHQARLLPLKVLSAQGSGTTADIAEAIRFAADQGADVINLSLGGIGDSQLLQEAIDYAFAKGAVIVAAAGNANQSSATYPARYPHVIGVSALDAASQKAPYSNFGAGVDLAAPGGSTQAGAAGGILQATLDPQTGQEKFAYLQGTSMAAPHVSGVAALVKAAGIQDPDAVFKVLKQSARSVNEDGLNYYGAGQLDATAAVQLAGQGQIDWWDFLRWLRDNGYLDPRFWIDPDVISLARKALMVVGAYLLAWFLRTVIPFRWNGWLFGGLLLGSSGVFLLRGLYIFDLPQWPLRLMGSSIPELGSALPGTMALNPLSASALLPLLLVATLLGHSQWRWFAIGATVGVAGCLMVSTFTAPALLWIGEGAIARLFLLLNAGLCLGLAYLALKVAVEPA